MIALDEDMVGLDRACVIAQGLKVCLGLFGRTQDMWLFGAHFTPGTPRADMDRLIGQIAQSLTSSVTSLTMVAKFDRWADASSGLTTAADLGRYFRTKLGFRGGVKYADLQAAPHSYDVRCDNGFSTALSWRATPEPNPVRQSLRADVYKLIRTADREAARRGVRQQITLVAPCDGTMNRALHGLPNNTGGFAVIPNDTFHQTQAAPTIGSR